MGFRHVGLRRIMFWGLALEVHSDKPSHFQTNEDVSKERAVPRRGDFSIHIFIYIYIHICTVA